MKQEHTNALLDKVAERLEELFDDNTPYFILVGDQDTHMISHVTSIPDSLTVGLLRATADHIENGTTLGAESDEGEGDGQDTGNPIG